MNLYEELFQISKLLLAEEDGERTPEVLLRRIVERCGAETGFVVVREEGSFQQKFDVGYDRGQRSAAERRYSRTLVREAIETGKVIYLANLIEDDRFSSGESALLIGRCCALVAPLRHGDEVYGVIYLENRARVDSFDAECRAFLGELAEVAGLFLLRASEREALRQRNRSLEQDLFSQNDFAGIVTRDPRLIELLRVVAQVASADAPILVLGETGTGKELIARALHVNSPRRGRPFVTVHCSALPGTLLESELFGHVAGAFTDAKRDRPGRLASAHGGTLFLDEVGEIPIEAQAKLLRFLQFGEIQRLGSDRTEKVDVRVVAATHRDLRQMIREGHFREDLYFRLKVLDLKLPPLRERRGDILLLADHFLRRHWRRAGEKPRWTSRTERVIASYHYPGNVRELSHLVERACLLARGPELDLDLLPPEVAGMAAGAPAPEPIFRELTGESLNEAREASVAEVERRFVEELMERCEGNVSRAARESGLHRSYLQKLLARHRPALAAEGG
ncbi:MAG: two-component system, NtrC family, response regulator PilR [Acidobacteriota bacterium]|jgi:Nif-specific regulatory protein/two-component system response regulator HydG|nr:two-component system, NtrC family, response regulator PilR [Acidobacteriota bacterium]